MVLKDVWNNFDGAEEFTYQRTEDICSQERLYAEEVI